MAEPLVEDTGGVDYASIGEELLAEPSTEVGTSGATEALEYQEPRTDLEFDLGSLGGLRESGKSHFAAAVARGMDMQQANLAALAGAVGDVTGNEGMAEWGYEGFAEQMEEAARNPAVVESWEDVHNMADLGTFVVEAIGENIPNLLTMATGGGIGINAAKAGIGKKLLQNAAANSAKIKARKKLGATIGTTAANYPLSTGEIAGEFREAGIQANSTVFLAGGVNTGLDVLGFNKIVGTVFGAGSIRSAKGLVKEGMKGFASAGITEFSTEAAQEAVQMVARAYEDPSYELYTADNMQRLINAGAKGMAAGGTIGGVGSVMTGIVQGSKEASAEAGKAAKDYLEGMIDPRDRDGGGGGVVTPASTALTVPGAEGLGTELNERAAQDAVNGLQDNDLGPTSIESKDTLQAGVDAIGRGGRLAAYSADPKGFQGVKIPGGMTVIPSVDGGSYVTEKVRASHIAELDKNGQQAEILGYPGEKSEQDNAVARAKDAQGRTVQDVSFHDDDVGVGREAALDQGRLAAGRGGNVEIITPEDALNDRANQIEDSTREGLQEQAETMPEVEIDIKHNTTGNIMKGLYGDGKITLKNGVRKVTMAPRDPSQTLGDPTENHPLVMKAMAKVFDDGKTEDRGRIEVYNPTSKGGTRARVSLPAVIALGKTLNRMNDMDSSNRRENLLTGLGHMYAHNFIPMQVTVQRDGKHQTFQLNKIVKGEPTKLAMPMDTVVDGRGTGTITFGQVMDRGPKKDTNRAEKNALVDKHDKLSAQLKAMTTGTQRDRNRATLKHKKPVRALWEEVQQLEKDLKKRGVKFTKSDVDPKDFEDAPQGTTAAEIEADVHSFVRGKEAKATSRPSPETEPDTRGLPSEDDQAADSARDVLRKKGWRPAGVFAHRNGQISVSEDIGQKLGNMAADIFKLLGIKSAINIVGDKGARDYINLMKEARDSNLADAEFIEMMNDKINTLESKIAEGQSGFVIYNDKYKDAEDRVPTIYINDNVTKKSKRIRVLVHELGHLVQRTMFDQAPKATQEAIIRSMSNIKASTSNRFEENFANMLWRYLVNLDVESVTAEERHEASKRLRSIVNQVNPREGMQQSDAQIKATQKDLQLATKFFKKLAAKLRKMWSHLSKVYKLDQEYKEFVDSLVGVRQQREGIAPFTSRFGKKYESIARDFASGPFMAYRTKAGPAGDNYSTADLRAFGNTAMRSRMGKNIMGSLRTARGALDMLNEKVLKSADAYLRSLEGSPRMQWLANEFHHQPGLKKKGRAYFEEVRHRMGNRQPKLNEILRGLPLSKKASKKAWWRQDQVDTTSPEYTQLWEALQNGTTISDFRAMGGVVGEAGVKIRQYLEEQRQWLEAQGVPVAKRANYWPVVMDKSAWVTEAGKTRIRELFQQHGYTLEYANKVIEAVNQGDGYLADILTHDESLMGPSFNFMKSRKLSPDLLNALANDPSGFMLKDMQGILQRYTHAAVERGVTQKRWGLTPNEKVRLQQAFVDLKIGQHINSPVAKIHFHLTKALKDGEITHAEFVTVKNRVLEAYFGRLGANLDPRWQKFQSFMIIAQNVRILSLATISAFVDAPQVAWRAGDAKVAYAGLKNYFDKATREELYEAAHLMGAIQDDLTEHVLNDQSTNAFMSPGAKAMNETFFRFIGMHKWTNMTRVMGLSTAREFLDAKAHEAAMGDAKAQADLAELGVTPEEIWAWQDAGRPSLEGDHDNVISALNTFIDEAVIRPDATTRPAWASDRHWQLLFHLKSFMWGYQEIIWKRIWNRAKAQPTVMKQLMHGGMSAAALMAVTMPVAIAGYELRRKISWFPMGAPARSEKTGFDYLGEVSERAGYPGIFQFILDANQAEEFGRSSLLSLMGPTVTHFEEFIRDDMVTWSSRSIPFLAQSGAGRTIYRNAIRDLGGS